MRRIWAITGLVVAVTLTILGYREYQKKVEAEARRSTLSDPASDDAPDRLVSDMFDKLRNDHQAWHSDTQQAVERVASLAEDGSRKTAETYYALALRLHGEGRMAESEKAYREAIALRPDWSWPYNGLGVVLFETGHEDTARVAFAKASELDPSWSRPHSDLSIMLRLNGRLDEAEKEAAKAVALAPNRLDALTAYGNVLKEQGRWEDARRYYEKAIQADPRHPTPYYNLACLYSLQDDPGKALDYLRKALEFDPAYARFAATDKDFDAIRDDPRFREVVK